MNLLEYNRSGRESENDVRGNKGILALENDIVNSGVPQMRL